MFDIAGRPTPARRPAGLFATKAALAATKISMNSSSESAIMNFLDVGHLGEHIESLYGKKKLILINSA